MILSVKSLNFVGYWYVLEEDQSLKELKPRKDNKSTGLEGYRRLKDAWLPFFGALGAGSHAMTPGCPSLGR